LSASREVALHVVRERGDEERLGCIRVDSQQPNDGASEMLTVVERLDPRDRRGPEAQEGVAVLAFAGSFEKPRAVAVELAFQL
jgi:hypothetical protein